MHHSYEGCRDNAAMAARSALSATDSTPALSAALRARARVSVGILRDAVRDFGTVVYASSLGAESIVLTDLIWTLVPEIQIVTIDTGRLPEETLALLDRLERRYQRRMQVYYPQAKSVEDYIAANGINGFYNGLEQRQGCSRPVSYTHLRALPARDRGLRRLGDRCAARAVRRAFRLPGERARRTLRSAEDQSAA